MTRQATLWFFVHVVRSWCGCVMLCHNVRSFCIVIDVVIDVDVTRIVAARVETTGRSQAPGHRVVMGCGRWAMLRYAGPGLNRLNIMGAPCATCVFSMFKQSPGCLAKTAKEIPCFAWIISNPKRNCDKCSRWEQLVSFWVCWLYSFLSMTKFSTSFYTFLSTSGSRVSSISLPPFCLPSGHRTSTDNQLVQRFSALALRPTPGPTPVLPPAAESLAQLPLRRLLFDT